MSDRVTDAEIAVLVDRIAEALRETRAVPCQREMVRLAGAVGWHRARRLVLDRVRGPRVRVVARGSV